ncbi:mitochondrial thiamine pyrophosphate carrier 1 [Zalerion maritima]|uniref:Mitochondrial thiamine pyrophosphate carrier 1 n=1 Tax=Zalerion maritima TaxID=339359 RepID=A0AAD5RJS2_9PEZI|nr:mitochondrial thiamine pyrophosphate carrier 1 [Zalerion maritima]
MSRTGERLKDEGSRLQVVAAGATAGLISRFIVAPLDVVKIRLQLQTHSLSDPVSQLNLPPGTPVYKGTLPTIKHILANEGLTGLWKGNIPAEMMYVCYSAVQFTAYRSTTMLLHRMFGKGTIPHPAESFISGASAGFCATAATYPLDLLRTRFAAQGNDKVYTSLFRAVRDIKRDEGYRGFFRGISAGVGQIVPFMGMFFALYETLRLPLGQFNLPFSSGDATAGIISSVIAKTAVFPLDLVRKRMQVQGPTRSRYIHKNIPQYTGIIKTLRDILKNEGRRGLYRGLTVSLIKAAPASAVTMWTYERTLNLLKQWEAKREHKTIQ